MADGPRDKERMVHRKPRPAPPHGGWGARKGHLTHGGAGRDGLGDTKPVLRRHLLEEALKVEADELTGMPARVAAAAAAAAAAAERQAATVLWPSLQDVPAGLRCSGEGMFFNSFLCLFSPIISMTRRLIIKNEAPSAAERRGLRQSKRRKGGRRVWETLTLGCEWTVRALQAEAVAAARRGVPPTWMALTLERRRGGGASVRLLVVLYARHFFFTFFSCTFSS